MCRLNHLIKPDLKVTLDSEMNILKKKNHTKNPYSQRKLTYGHSSNKTLTCTGQYIIITGVSSPRATWNINRKIFLQNRPGPEWRTLNSAHMAYDDLCQDVGPEGLSGPFHVAV